MGIEVTEKPQVHFYLDQHWAAQVGGHAQLTPIDHPNVRLNNLPARTSTVQWMAATGNKVWLETHNTLYIGIHDEEIEKILQSQRTLHDRSGGVRVPVKSITR